jgi:hypothetical protein
MVEGGAVVVYFGFRTSNFESAINQSFNQNYYGNVTKQSSIDRKSYS